MVAYRAGFWRCRSKRSSAESIASMQSAPANGLRPCLSIRCLRLSGGVWKDCGGRDCATQNRDGSKYLVHQIPAVARTKIRRPSAYV